MVPGPEAGRKVPAQGATFGPHKVGLLYLEAPCGAVEWGAGRWQVGGHRPTLTDRGAFLRAVEGAAANALLAVREYNRAAAGSPLPRVEVLQFCLISAGPQRHPDASRLDVAAALVRGLAAGAAGAGAAEDLPLVRLAHDPEGALQRAAEALGGPAAAP
ncbi:unnamed protein product [Prorocentrum cordatum]|uniref:Uncharacterized protein n=1 Tax=Prorocentrum cordatum TaxID=2364126 RepID=A0ABN9QZ60_9DINO|nr:unnamed protein product [Polarella glacialis]